MKPATLSLRALVLSVFYKLYAHTCSVHLSSILSLRAQRLRFVCMSSILKQKPFRYYLPVKGAVALEKIRKKFGWCKSWIFISMKNVQMRAKMSKSEPKRPRVSQNVKCEPKHSRSRNNARAKISKRQLKRWAKTKRQSTSWNIMLDAKTSWHKPKHPGASQNVKAPPEMVGAESICRWNSPNMLKGNNAS